MLFKLLSKISLTSFIRINIDLYSKSYLSVRSECVQEAALENFIDPVRAQQLFASAATGLGVVFLFAIISTAITMNYLKGRRITFMLVFWGLFLIFSLTFYGLNFVMRDIWKLEESMGGTAIYIVSLGTALGLMSLYALYCKFSIQQGPSWLQKELDELPEEKLSPMDIKRREHMAKYRRK